MTEQHDAALKRTPLNAAHKRLGAKMVPFSGWEMPVQYTGIVEEHRAVRSAVGIFDVSHMGEFDFHGPDAVKVLQELTTNDVASLGTGQVHYSLMCTPEGGIVDDLTLCRLGDDHFMMTVNAANIPKDFAWVKRYAHGSVAVADRSDGTALLAVQGPMSEGLVGRLTDTNVAGIGYYRFASGLVAGVDAVISRTGYTGEDGFELYLSAGQAETVWDAILAEGKRDGVVPVGLGARDTLRLEMKYVLYGQDIDETTSPLEAGLGWVVKLSKGDFIGRDAIAKVKETGPGRKLVGFEMVDRAVARHGYRILKDGREIGCVTSGSYGPSVEKYIGVGYVWTEHSTVGSEFEVEVRGKAQRARVVQTPFHPPHVKK